MTQTTAGARPGAGTTRHVEHLMGMPISLALRGRHADTIRGREAWDAVVDELREVDRVFSTYRSDSFISRLGRGELGVDACPPEVAEVLALGRAAEEQSGGAFSVTLPAAEGRRLDDRAGRAAPEGARGHRLLPLGRR
jgi:thiamine biosynthesis lipoprotein